MRTGEQRRRGGRKHEKIHIIAYFCVLDHESVRISGNSDCCKILELFSNREGEKKSQQKPCHLPKYHLLSAPCPPLLIISSHPAAEHPSPSTVTMSNADARVFQRSRKNCTFTESRSASPVRASQKRTRLGSSPPRVRVCLIGEGWRAQGSR